MSRFKIWAKNNKPTAIKQRKSIFGLLRTHALFFIALVVIFSSLATILQPQTSLAASTATLTPLDNQIIANLYRNALATCFKSAPLKDDTPVFLSLIPEYRTAINEGHALDFEWFSPGSAFSLDIIAGSVLNSAYGSGTVSKSGVAECGNPAFIKEALAKLGYDVKSGNADSVFGLLCDFGFQRSGGNGCKSGSGDWHRTKNSGDATYTAFMKTPNAQVTPLSDAAKYVLVRSTFMALCKATESNNVPNSSLSDTTGITIKSLEGTDLSTFKMIDHWFTYGTASSRTSWSATVGVGEGYSVGITNLDHIFTFPAGSLQIDGGLRGNSVAVGQPYVFATGTAIGTQSACGALGGSANQYEKAYYAWAIKNPAGAIQQAATIKQQPPNDTTSTCAIDGIGWILCPVIKFLAGIADASFGFLSNNFLKTDPKVLDTSAANGTFTAWSAMRTIANVAFVIIFLIIIFSQLTSLGVSNYGVKKMLPRLIIAAILVNLSYFISQLAVDISNILGFSIKNLFDGISTQITTANTKLTSDPTSTGAGLAGLAGTVVATVVAGGAAYALLSTFVPILLAAVVALIMILFILLARQAIIILLIVISPLAFVAFLLPNTEKFFTQWRKMLTAMLLLFPIIALVYGASQLASKILSSAEAYKDASGTGGDLFGQIIAAGILVLPLFVVPVLLKKSLEGIPVLGKMATGLANRTNKNLGGKLKESYATSAFGMGRSLQKTGAENYRKRRFAEKAGKGGFYGAVSKGIRITPMQRAGAKNVGRSASAAVEKAEADDVSAEQSNLERVILSGPTTADSAFTEAVAKGDTVKAKAALNIKFQTAGGRTEAHDLIASAEASSSFGPDRIQALQRHIASQHPAIDTLDSTLGRWSHGETAASGGRDLLSLETDVKTFELADTKMAGQAKKGLVGAAISGHLDMAAANRILANDNLTKDLKPPEREFLDHIASGLAPRASDLTFR